MLPYKTKGKRILFCPGCKRVYENVRMYGGIYKQKNKVRTYKGQAGEKPKYYPGLSSYGLTRKLCPECIEIELKEFDKYLEDNFSIK